MATDCTDYNFSKIEPYWQEYWEKAGTFQAKDHSEKTKYYVLDMFPYPSGAGLHIGHPEGYTASDILARYKRARGFNVLHPMGWDAFGLPAEQYAIKTGTHPATTTKVNIENFRRQIKRLDPGSQHHRSGLLPLDTVDISPVVQARPRLCGRATRMVVPQPPCSPRQ